MVRPRKEASSSRLAIHLVPDGRLSPVGLPLVFRSKLFLE